MNFKEAVKILKNARTLNILDVDWDNKTIRKEGLSGAIVNLNAKETISLARYWTSDKGGRWKGDVKNFSDKKNRARTRDLINKGEFDKIPQEGPVKEEDPWGWD